jgi:hypothetical protein
MALAAISIIALTIGIGLGLTYTWMIDPVIEQNTRPDQLNPQAKHDYVVAVALDYAETGNLERAYRLLIQIEPEQDPFQLAADTLCELTRTGQVQSSTDIIAMRQLIALFQPQGNVEVNCEIGVYATAPPPLAITPTPSFTPSPTIRPVDSKTPTPGGVTPTAVTFNASPTPSFSRRDFQVVAITPVCARNQSGQLQVFVRDRNGIPIPGVEVAVSWTDERGLREESFFTGLKPEVNDGYADFIMTPGETYQVQLVGRSGLSDPREAYVCAAEDIIISWEVIFQAVE